MPKAEMKVLKAKVFGSVQKLDDVNKRAKQIIEKHRSIHGICKARRRTSSFDASYLSDNGSKSSSVLTFGGQTQKSADGKPVEITDNMEKIFIYTLGTFLNVD